ncbi:spondin domain-containing protein [Deferrisoma palaeochoriense]
MRTVLWTFSVFAALSGAVGLTGCGGDDGDGPRRAEYRITVINATNRQPLSPPVAIVHQAGYEPWAVGETASDGLERLAEAGDGAALLAEAAGNPAVVDRVAAASAVAPGASWTVTRSVEVSADLAVDVAGMLVNTNDGFAAARVAAGNLPVGGVARAELIPYDAGTETNTETAETIPGPAGGGEGYNPEREAGGGVRVHPGVVTAAEGLAGSALDASHRFLAPVGWVEVERLR